MDIYHDREWRKPRANTFLRTKAVFENRGHENFTQEANQAKIKAEYEGQTYELQSGFFFDTDSYERQGNGKGDMINRGRKKILNIKYTPDFVSDTFIIECKGRANESFPLRWKMFKKHVKERIPHVTLYKPQNQKECDRVVELINKRK